jgi:Gram-negative bacterial TonB protein C-terminal
VQGKVILNAMIAEDGSVAELSVAEGHPLLAPPALEAVKWQYQADDRRRQAGRGIYALRSTSR